MTTASTATASWRGQIQVLATRRLHARATLADSSLFIDDVWDLTPALLRVDIGSRKLDFTTVPAEFVEPVKRLCLALLTCDRPPGEPKLSIASIYSYFTLLRTFLHWLHDHGHTLTDLDEQQLGDYHDELVAQRLSANHIRGHRRAIRMLWLYRARLGEQHLRSDPARIALWRAWSRSQRRVRENTTDRIPETVIGPLMTWAMRWVDDFADDILTARQADRIEQDMLATITDLLGSPPRHARLSRQRAGRLARLLQIACWIVIAYLSGMRDSEIKHLQRGCVTVQRDPTGRIYRHRLHSLAFKGERPEGVPATWIVTAPVARAVAVLERLHPAEQPYLFALPPEAPNRGQHGRLVTNSTTGRHLDEFIAWINGYVAAHDRTDGIADHGRPVHLAPRQFRRTLAWFIARRPGGTIAGALQYRHQRIQMFEGYAGTSASGFRDEVAAEDALARGQFLADTSTETAQLTGPAAAEAQQRLAEFARHAVFEGRVVTDEARLARIMARHDPHLYPGTFITCVYNPDRALCRRKNNDTEQGPVMGDCQPLACRNTTLTPDNRDTLAHRLAELDQALADGDRLAPYVRHRLQQQHDELAEFLARHTPETS
ncbi:site-specific integrase [Saccharopolyspora endophytica]|uniref:Site-specific integrase n=1 Tax=Saccharopolyspora endophytica TaxID=543886 RepID=A0ABS5DMM4_9PSEU|nr:site-specific integrase [Saccharopolyspora endophytica]MBQ0927541.1 site-specific integrase [Saccharopolyspora endophytica]